MNDTKEPITRAVTAMYGERCADFSPDCSCCKAWAELDAIEARKELPHDTMELVGRLREDADYIDNYDGFIGSPHRISRNQAAAADALEAKDREIAELRHDLERVYQNATGKLNRAEALAAKLEKVKVVLAEIATNNIVCLIEQSDESRLNATAAKRIYQSWSSNIQAARKVLEEIYA